MHRFIFQLFFKDEGQRLPRIAPYIFRGVIMTFLNSIDPKFVEELHAPNEIRPYAFSLKREKQLLNFHLISLKEDISSAILKAILNIETHTFMIVGREFHLGKINFETIPITSLMRNPLRIEKFRLRFLTPTYFNIRDRPFDIRFPEPTFLFSNLTKVWNRYAPIGCQVDESAFYEWVSRHVFVSSYDLQTRSISIGKGIPKVCCIGWVNYLIVKSEEKYSNWIDILLKFAEYVNLGGNRTAACGVVSYRPLETKKAITDQKLTEK